MSYVSRVASDGLMARLRRNQAALIMAGGRLPDEGGWIETIDYPVLTVRPPGAWRWHVVSDSGWWKVGSTWPIPLIVNAPDLYFRSDSEGRCHVDTRP